MNDFHDTALAWSAAEAPAGSAPSLDDARDSLLERIDGPAALRRLPVGALPGVAQELRRFLIGSVARSGGHLAASLGTVELSVALHYVFDTPREPIVWDVGHQAYAHKVLTGRRERMGSIRQRGGLSGFLKRSESVHDAFGAGHASTSISAALGMAMASQMAGRRGAWRSVPIMLSQRSACAATDRSTATTCMRSSMRWPACVRNAGRGCCTWSRARDAATRAPRPSPCAITA